MTPPDEDRPYTVYGAGASRSGRGSQPPAGGGEDRPYTTYKARPKGLLARLRGQEGLDELRPEAGGGPPGDKGPRTRKPITVGRVVKWVALAVVAWVGFSLVLFLVSAQLEQGRIKTDLGGAGYPLWAKNTILLIGTDQRPKNSKEPGANSGPSRSDTLMLIRTGAGAGARLSIPRDTVVDIPGHGQNKINAAYAFGGVKLTVKTIDQYLGVHVNHVAIVDFTNFPKFIDAMGGVTIKTGCIHAEISGGRKNGGQTIILKKGEHHVDGTLALALSRIRHNDCNPAESDLTRVRRQQEILSAVKSRLVSPGAFFRLPWVSWRAPKAIKSDMSGPTLLGVLGGMAAGGTPPVRILKPSGGVTLPDGGAGLVVSEAEKRRDVARFLKG
ncbi:MAG TPA: LCP family protein [Solirubrobacteraceae bacterium]|jgi:LCP family protein required for cell wall assembly